MGLGNFGGSGQRIQVQGNVDLPNPLGLETKMPISRERNTQTKILAQERSITNCTDKGTSHNEIPVIKITQEGHCINALIPLEALAWRTKYDYLQIYNVNRTCQEKWP